MFLTPLCLIVLGTWNTCTRMSVRGKASAPQVSSKLPSTVTAARVVAPATAAASSASPPLRALLHTSSHLPRCTSQLSEQELRRLSTACTLHQDPLWRKVGSRTFRVTGVWHFILYLKSEFRKNQLLCTKVFCLFQMQKIKCSACQDCPVKAAFQQNWSKWTAPGNKTQAYILSELPEEDWWMLY